MKKIIALALAAFFGCSALMAQDPAKIFGRNKSFNIAWVHQDLKSGDVKWKSSEGVAMFFGTTYMLHKNPVADMIKFGIDANWTDINFVKYPKHISVAEDFDYDYDYGFDDALEDVELKDLGVYQLDLGIGVGPSVTIAPFANFSNQLPYLKAQVYFHYIPSYSLLLISENDETKLNHGFCNFFSVGARFSWKLLSVGFETRFGSAKYKMAEFNDDLDYDYDDDYDFSMGDIIKSGGKQKFSTMSTRLYVGLRF